MPPKRNYEVGESFNSCAITEAKARRRAYLEMWRNVRYPKRDDEVSPPPPQTAEERHQVDTPMPPSTEEMQDSDEDTVSEQEKNYIITSAGERVQFKWGRCIGTGPDPEEEDEEDPKEGEPPEENLEEIPEEEWQQDAEESEDPEENLEEESEEGEEEEDMEEYAGGEQEPAGDDDEDEDGVWEINEERRQPLKEDDDIGYVDEAIEREPEEIELSGLEYDEFPSDDDLH